MEEFDERFILKKYNNYVDEDSIGEVATGYGYTNEEIKQFISDLRKKDKSELIKMLPKDDNSETFLYRNRVKKIIKDYYEN